MKIIGFVSIEGKIEIVLKGDSCLLNNRKPFFLPDWTADVRYTPCVVLRVSRLGKHIAPKFAHRYYDALAAGADFAAQDVLDKARKEGGSWTPALAFDYSLAIGGWITGEEPLRGEGALQSEGLIIAPEEAIARASDLMTIRQGDMIYIQRDMPNRRAEREDVIAYSEAWGQAGGQESELYCKIK